MDLLTTVELSDIRAAQLDALPDTATIQTRTLTSDGNGGKLASYTAGGTSACRLSFAGNNPSYRDIAVASKISPQQLYIVTLPHDASVTETSRLVINGATYDVLTALNQRSWQTAKRMLVKRV